MVAILLTAKALAVEFGQVIKTLHDTSVFCKFKVATGSIKIALIKSAHRQPITGQSIALDSKSKL